MVLISYRGSITFITILSSFGTFRYLPTVSGNSSLFVLVLTKVVIAWACRGRLNENIPQSNARVYWGQNVKIQGSENKFGEHDEREDPTEKRARSVTWNHDMRKWNYIYNVRGYYHVARSRGEASRRTWTSEELHCIRNWFQNYKIIVIVMTMLSQRGYKSWWESAVLWPGRFPHHLRADVVVRVMSKTLGVR